jgi:chromosome partitioning protein
MAVVITMAQQKGGTGKTTLAANLAATLGASRRVAVLDIDPQRSLTHWCELRRSRPAQPVALAFSDVSGWRLPAELDRLKGGHDVVVIDSPPQIDTDARLAVRAADIVLVPVQPSMPDVWAAEGTLQLAAAERRRTAIVLNRVPPASRLRDAIVVDLASRDRPVLRTAIGNRTGFASAFAEGLGVTEAAPRSSAAKEMRALVDELLEMTQ